MKVGNCSYNLCLWNLQIITIPSGSRPTISLILTSEYIKSMRSLLTWQGANVSARIHLGSIPTITTITIESALVMMIWYSSLIVDWSSMNQLFAVWYIQAEHLLSNQVSTITKAIVNSYDFYKTHHEIIILHHGYFYLQILVILLVWLEAVDNSRYIWKLYMCQDTNHPG